MEGRTVRGRRCGRREGLPELPAEGTQSVQDGCSSASFPTSCGGGRPNELRWGPTDAIGFLLKGAVPPRHLSSSKFTLATVAAIIA
jgi:hypothetical protein